MKPLKTFAVQCSDLLAYSLVPLLSLLMPADASRRWIARLARWDWLLAEDLRASLAQARNRVAIADGRAWMRRARLTALLEVRDLALIQLGRGPSVYAEIENAGRVTEARDRVLIGMHWGPSIAILGLLRHHGQAPLLVYRKVEPSIRRARPFLYRFLVRSVRYIRETCGEDRAITIKGAGRRLAEQLPRPGTSVVVLDAPPAPGRSTLDGQVLGTTVLFNAGFPKILRDSNRACQFYAISLKPGMDGARELELEPPMRPGDALIDRYCEFLDAHLASDSAQWRIWQVADQFFHDGAADPAANLAETVPAEAVY